MKKFIVWASLFFMSLLAVATDKPKDKEKDKDKKTSVDSGSFGIYLNGKRIGTEKFDIEQQQGIGVATAEITVDDGSSKAEQSSEMRVGADGSLKLYKWRSTLPEKEESTIEPDQELLVEHVITADQKKRDVPYVVPLSTVILDDNFFSQRELLIWRYLTSGCRKVPAQGTDQSQAADAHLECQPAHFGILVPRQHAAGTTVVELVGPDKITVKGTPHELNKFKVDTDGVQWLIWMEDDYKVTKMAVPSGNIEVWRD